MQKNKNKTTQKGTRDFIFVSTTRVSYGHLGKSHKHKIVRLRMPIYESSTKLPKDKVLTLANIPACTSGQDSRSQADQRTAPPTEGHISSFLSHCRVFFSPVVSIDTRTVEECLDGSLPPTDGVQSQRNPIHWCEQKKGECKDKGLVVLFPNTAVNPPRDKRQTFFTKKWCKKTRCQILVSIKYSDVQLRSS